jgi:hypothetical protein
MVPENLKDNLGCAYGLIGLPVVLSLPARELLECPFRMAFAMSLPVALLLTRPGLK